jgi:DNA-binding transcriptional MerR regulator
VSRSPTTSSLLTIGEVARRSGVPSSALRFYEQRGLIRSERTGSGHRRYRRPVLRRIAFNVFAQRVGLTLEEIGVELAKLPPHRAHAPRLVAALAYVGLEDRRTHRRARTAPARAHGVHRLRLPFARPLQARQPWRPCGPPRPGPSLLDRRPSRELTQAWPRALSARSCHEHGRRAAGRFPLWQKTNVTAFLVSGIATNDDEANRSAATGCGFTREVGR